MLAPGVRFGGYTLSKQLGLQSGAVRWLASAPSGELVEVEAAPSAPSTIEQTQSRLQADAEVLTVRAPENLVRVLEVGFAEGLHFIVTEHRAGIRFAALFDEPAQEPWPSPLQATLMIREAAQAVVALEQLRRADGQKFWHPYRGLSPAQLVLGTDGRVRLGELLRLEDDRDTAETISHDAAASFAYLSPELAAAVMGETVAAIDHPRSLVFILGTFWYQLLARRTLFLRESGLETLRTVRRAEVPPLPASVPTELADAVLRCLDPRPEARFESPARLSWALDALLSEDTTARGTRDTVPSEPPSAAVELGAQPPASEHRPSGRDIPTSATPSRRSALGAPKDAEKNALSNHPRFEELERLGSGGMGEVYRVRDRELNEEVALKVIPARLSAEPQSLERLRREVRLARRIASEHVCRIFDIVELGGGARGLTMGLVNGTTLAELMKRGLPVDYSRIARWGADIADGLAAAHALAIVHRDLKPENVMITADDRAVILDFGIARSAEDSESANINLTQAGIILGTPLYMSPEQLTNRPLDGRADLYGLGLILAELLTGQVPLWGSNYHEILDVRVLKATRFRLAELDPSAPPELSATIDRLLEPAASDRPATAFEVSACLRALAQGAQSPITFGVGEKSSTGPREDAMAPSASNPQLTPSRAESPESASRERWPWVAMLAVLSVLVVLLGAWLVRSNAPSPRTPPAPHAVPAAKLAEPTPDIGKPATAPNGVNYPGYEEEQVLEPVEQIPPTESRPPRRERSGTIPPPEEM